MTAASIAFATDVAARIGEGGTVERGDGFRIVRTPGNPAFRWGNFVLVDGGTALDDPDAWARVHRRAFPEAGFVAIGVDDAEARFDEAAWRVAGFDVQRAVVLRARAADVERPDADVAEIADDAGWADVLAITLEDVAGEAGYEAFARARVAAERAATARGRAAWLGLREDGRIVSTLGILPASGGVARYQNVGTLAAHRRRGHAGRLIRAAAALAARRWGAEHLVILADADGPAIGLYRRLGFTDAETQVELTRIEAS